MGAVQGGHIRQAAHGLEAAEHQGGEDQKILDSRVEASVLKEQDRRLGDIGPFVTIATTTAVTLSKLRGSSALAKRRTCRARFYLLKYCSGVVGARVELPETVPLRSAEHGS